MQAKFPRVISLNTRVWLALILGLIWWVTGWVCIDWVLNYAVYQGMTELWLIQIPFTSIDVATSPWQAYFLSFIQIHVSLALLVYEMKHLMK
jgi:hypothetical protein